jgi:hypothetical protein
MKRDWSRPLTRPLDVPGIMKLKTLADVHELLRHLPKEYRAKSTWQYVEKQLNEAAHGTIDAIDVAVPLRMALMLEGVPYRL